jgi:hypothetical protein
MPLGARKRTHAFGRARRLHARGCAGAFDYTPAMLLDRALRATVRNYSTLFLLVAVVTVPLEVAHAYVFRRVIAVSELHPAIERFPSHRKVGGVGPRQLGEARVVAAAVTALELLSLPFLARAATRIVEVDRAGGVPTLLGIVRRTHRTPPLRRLRRIPTGPLLAAAAVGLAVAWLARAVGLVVVEPLPDAAAFAGVGLVDGVARAAGGAFFVGPAASLWVKDT